MKRAPSTGYELMAAVDGLFAPEYQASPGSVYPALAALEEERLIKTTDTEAPFTYALTRAGGQALDSRLSDLEVIERRTGRYLRPQDSVSGELDRLVGLVWGVQGKADPGNLAAILKDTQLRIIEIAESDERRDSK